MLPKKINNNDLIFPLFSKGALMYLAWLAVNNKSYYVENSVVWLSWIFFVLAFSSLPDGKPRLMIKTVFQYYVGLASVHVYCLFIISLFYIEGWLVVCTVWAFIYVFVLLHAHDKNIYRYGD